MSTYVEVQSRINEKRMVEYEENLKKAEAAAQEQQQSEAEGQQQSETEEQQQPEAEEQAQSSLQTEAVEIAN